MIEQFKAYIAAERLFDPAAPLLLAVSGGLDSTVLVHLCVQAGLRAEVAHCNFRLRGGESDRDEQFVRALAATYGLPFHVQHFDTDAYAAGHKLSTQTAARELRYAWLEALRKQQGLAFIATAHHMQDNVETFWMNISKGTGMTGMHGILPLQGKIVRPLLFATREEIAAYAGAHGLQHVEDSSNETDKYTRNYFRHQVLPKLEAVFPEVVKNTGATIQRMREAETLYRQAVEAQRKKLVEQKGAEFFIPILKLRQAEPLATMLYELLKPFGFSASQAAQVQQLLDSEPGKWVASATHRLVRDRKWLIITPLEAAVSAHFIIEEGQEQVLLPGDMEISIRVSAADGEALPAAPDIASLDKSKLQFPLLLRKWKQGDYFYPLGMQKKKKLSRFFIDQKLSLPEKEKVWVLESAQRIVWVAGLRIDDRFKVTPASKEICRLQLKMRLH
ncbi:tRNA lysidine(34) synthetase TilS [Chitinophaga lutea]|uniref:tRNA(Ile)-lysidine synthase n=1 Tax=Chitinophaga lutea TaxID=2488634 RepID=A0A3N4PSM2_9BACT|nr:tRNA lysidine(34) synthetase TilS [Chitinophaga lutea]RPE08001.1 tRNA lysidine(34) synthetase TilS [Chitinophaga lutea]